MSVSEWFTDDELISQLRMFFESDEEIDYEAGLSQLIEVDEENFQIKIKNRVFQFNKSLCDVFEVNNE